MSLQENIGKAILQLRKERKISQENLALEAGIDRKYMSDIENGKRNVSIEIIERLASFFHMPVSYFFYLAEQQSQPSWTLDDLKKYLVNRGNEDAVVLTGPDFLSAVMGISEDGRVVYSYEKMASWLVNNEDMDEMEAMEDIDFNVIRALPYMGEKAPIIMFDLDL